MAKICTDMIELTLYCSNLNLHKASQLAHCFFRNHQHLCPGPEQDVVMTEDAKRDSRAALSKARSVPEWLLLRFPLPDEVMVHHTVHKDSTLPLFQGRLGGGEVFESKTLDVAIQLATISSFCLIERIISEDWNTAQQRKEFLQRELQP